MSTTPPIDAAQPANPPPADDVRSATLAALGSTATLIGWFAITMLVFCRLGLTAISTPTSTWNFFGNADLLYSFDFAEDMHRGASIADWHLTPAPYLFPDLFRAYFVTFFFKDPRTTLLFEAMLQIIALATLWATLAWRIGGRSWAYFAHAGFLAALTFGFRAEDSGYRSLWFLDCHAGNILCALITFHVLLSFTRGKSWALILLPPTCALFTLSDHFFVACCASPIIASLLLTGWLKRRVRWVALGALMWWGLMGGYAIRPLLTAPSQVLRFSLDVAALDRLKAYDTWWFIPPIILIIAALPVIVRGLRERSLSNDDHLVLLFSTGGLVNFFANTFSTWEQPIQIRYLLPTVWFAVFALLFALARFGRALAPIGVATSAIAFAVSLFLLRDAPGFQKLMAYTPPEALCVEEMAKSWPLESGLADYLGARPIAMMTKARYPMAAIRGPGFPNFWISGRWPFDNALEHANFIVVNRLDPALLTTWLGAPTVKGRCDAHETEVWYYEGQAAATLRASLRSMFDQAFTAIAEEDRHRR